MEEQGGGANDLVALGHGIMCQRIPHIFWWGGELQCPRGGFIQIIAIPLGDFKKAPLDKRGGNVEINKTAIFSK
jgi:hypothetical protein